MEKVFRSVALVRRVSDEKLKWLAIWDESAGWWDFIIGARLESESFRETVVREVAWRLNLNRQRDFLVSNMAQLNMEYIGELPGDLRQKHIAVAFYAVDLYRAGVTARLGQSTEFTWLSSAEVCSGQQDNGPLLNPLICHWINNWQVILPWQ